MPPALLCPNEDSRLQALHDLDILDTLPDEVFDSFVRIARGLFGVPMAAISLVDADRQWFKAALGLSVTETPREQAFCAHVLLDPGSVACINDARQDPRFADNPLVTGAPGIRFYAGAPLVDADGHALGTLCVIDTEARAPGSMLLDQLRDLATGVMAALRLHAASRRLADEARRDPLTGLSNRREFDAALDNLGPQGGTLFMIDLDNFKAVNDAFGHTGADDALRAVASRLQGAARRGDRMFRLSGDAFACLATGLCDQQAAQALARVIRAALRQPFKIDEQTVPLGASIGIASMPLHARESEQLLRAADAALYAAKRGGRGMIKMARSDARPGGRAGDIGMGRVTMRDMLRQALLKPQPDQFHLHFQPVIDLDRGCVSGHEALVRWTLPGGLHIGPGDFVPVAEDRGLVSHLDRWVLRHACAIAAGWPAPWNLSVNVSPVTVGLLDVVGLVRETLVHTGLASSRLVIEVTETAGVADPNRMVNTINGLRELGVRPVVDDFGAGHASLAYLRRYPFDCIKTDRCFVAGLGTDPRAAPVMEAMVRLTRSLDILLIAEGVETEDQLMILHRLRVPMVQGYLLARPVPADQIARATERAERKLGHILKRRARTPAAARLPDPPGASAALDWWRDGASKEKLPA